MIKKLTRFMARHGFEDFKIIEGELIFFTAGEGHGVNEIKSRKIQKEWIALESAIVMTGRQYRQFRGDL